MSSFECDSSIIVSCTCCKHYDIVTSDGTTPNNPYLSCKVQNYKIVGRLNNCLIKCNLYTEKQEQYELF